MRSAISSAGILDAETWMLAQRIRKPVLEEQPTLLIRSLFGARMRRSGVPPSDHLESIETIRKSRPRPASKRFARDDLELRADIENGRGLRSTAMNLLECWKAKEKIIVMKRSMASGDAKQNVDAMLVGLR